MKPVDVSGTQGSHRVQALPPEGPKDTTCPREPLGGGRGSGMFL